MSNQLQYKLSHYEVEPPAGMWDAITEALDDQSSVVAGKLQSIEVTPKNHVWEQIKSNLEATTEIPGQKIPTHNRFSRPLRYGSAVAILVLVAVTITLLVNKNTASGELAQQPAVINKAKKPPKTIKAPQGTPSTTSDREPVLPTKEPATIKEQNTASSGPYTAEQTNQEADDNRYLTVASETGKPVRLSKKVYPVFDCAEHSTALKRHQCRENIESLQKMASSLASPSGDFASLIDMIKTLEENR